MAIAEAPAPVSTGSPEVAEGAVTVRPNRHRLSDIFPSLSFSIYTGGLPYYDVVLTTDPSLFDGANAGKRTPSTFYASHQDGGLGAAKNGHASYLVPSAVIRGFAAATPKPAAIYYTAIAYADRDGKGAVYAMPPDQLATQAPSIALAPDFKGHTLARIMGVSSDKLRVVADTPANGAGTHAGGAIDDDAGEGDGAYGLPPPAITGPAPIVAPAAEDGYVLQHMVLPHGPAPQGEATPVRRPLPTAASKGAEYRTQSAPGYLGDDEDDGEEPVDGEAYAASPRANGSNQPTQRVAIGAQAVGDEHLSFRSLDDGSPIHPATVATPARRLDADAKRKIIHRIAREESRGDYAAINADGEFEGKFPGHPATGKYHIGLSFGLIQFAQDSSLGALLTAMRDRDPKAFRDIFDEHADELIQVTTAAGPPSSESPDGRSARVQPVGGADLWKEPWLSRFKRAGQYQPFQEVQDQLAVSRYLDPMLQFATWFGLDSERALALVVDRSVQMGVGGAKRWIASTVGPVSTPALQQQALATLGQTGLQSFQAATPGLEADGVLGPMTHAALTAALRKLGPASPVPVMTRDQMLDALVRRAAGHPWRARVEGLRNDAGLSDEPFEQ